MRRPDSRVHLMLSVALAVSCWTGCEKDSGSSPAPVAETPVETVDDPATGTTTPVTYGGTVAGTVALSAGAPESSIAGANVSVAAHPELSAVTDASGAFEMHNVLPGTLELYVTSADGAALTAGAAAYGVKFPEVIVSDGKTTDLGTSELKRTGSLTGRVTFLENPNDLALAGSDVFVPGTSFLAKTGDDGSFTLGGLPEGSYKLQIQHTGFAVQRIDAVTIVSGETADLGEVPLSLSTGPEGSLAVRADTTVTVGGEDRLIATSRTVTVDFKFDRDASLMKLSDEPSFLNKAWKPVTASKTWEFASDGRKQLYVMYSDLNGLESSPFSAEVYVDTEVPVLTSASILNGWATTAGSVNPIDLVATDSGAGLAQVQVSLTGPTFSDALPWLDYADSIDFDVGASLGLKTAYVRVKDHAGRVSEVVSDAITRDTTTEVDAGASYDRDVVLKAAQQPFVIASTTFNKNLTIEPGTTVILKDEGPVGAIIDVKGALKAEGLNFAQGKITFTYETAGECDGSIVNKNAAPGTGAKTRLKYVVFDRLASVDLSGGIVSNNRFSSLGCSVSGVVRKYGKDPLTFASNDFDNWDTALDVRDGNGATSISGTTGNMQSLLIQQLTANATTVVGNDVTLLSHWDRGGINVKDGTINFGAGNVFAGSGIVFRAGAGVARTFSGATITGCSRIAAHDGGTGAGLMTIENSTIACNFAVADSNGNIKFLHNDMTILYSLVGVYMSHVGTFTFERNHITLANGGDATYFADLFAFWKFDYTELNVAMTNNDIHCVDADGCRGGLVIHSQDASGNPPTGDFNAHFSGNHWSALAPVAITGQYDCGAEMVCADNAGFSGAGRTKDGTAIKFYEYIDAHDTTTERFTAWNVTGDFVTNNSSNEPNVGRP